MMSKWTGQGISGLGKASTSPGYASTASNRLE